MLLWDDGRVMLLHRGRLHRFMLLCFLWCISVFSFVMMSFSSLPDNIMLLKGDERTYNTRLPIDISVNTSRDQTLTLSGGRRQGGGLEAGLLKPLDIESDGDGRVNFELSLLGVIPVKHVTVSVAPQIKVIPGGQSVGVKLSTKGVMVVGINPVEDSEGRQHNPSLDAGIELGDTIIKIDGTAVKNSGHVSDLINNNRGRSLKLTMLRKDREFEVNVTPVKAKEDNQYKIGVWIRDSTSGVGTLTFICPDSNMFAALGHPITDVDTGILLSVSSGRIVSSKIISIQPGQRGKPGELRGMFIDNGDDLGTIERNTPCGIYGKTVKRIDNGLYGEPISVGLQSQVREGPAKILTTISGNEVKAYDIVIEKLTAQSKPNSKSMIIRVTDPELLERTGGIVQGMSGSPIIQDDRIVGAVTHVFINRPDMGYGIYIEWMLREAGIKMEAD